MEFEIKNYFNKKIKLIKLKKFTDNRGFFCETYNKKNLKKFGINSNFVQDNYSFSINQGTVRGLHFQIKPYEQGKLLRVLKGEIFDVCVDIRKNSPTFGQYKTFNLSDKKFEILYIAKGFAHGFFTLKNSTEILYKVTDYYSSKHEKTILWNDTAININWPKVKKQIKISKKDKLGISLEKYLNMKDI